ncbi:MAG: ABC transporter permease [Pirellulales bacterium]
MPSTLSAIVWLTLRVSCAAVALSALAGIPCGVALGLLKFPGKRAASALVHTGMALPPVVVGLLVYLLLSRSGPLAVLGWLYTPAAMIVAQTLLALPFVVGITMSAVEAVPAELPIQLRSLGASPGQIRWTILRQARHGVLLAVAAAFGRSLSEVGAVYIVGGDIAGHTRVLTTAIMLETRKGEFALALWLGAALVGLALAINLLMLWLQGRARR